MSRELLQNNRTVEKIKSALVKRSLDLLEDLAANKPEEYAEFWKTFGVVLKEGIIEDPAKRSASPSCCAFIRPPRAAMRPRSRSTHYVSRMKPDQKAIYYLTADTLAAARNSPHLEGFRAKGMEVLLLTDRIDEWVAGASARVRGQAARQCRERRRRRRLGDRDAGEGRRRIRVQGHRWSVWARPCRARSRARRCRRGSPIRPRCWSPASSA